MYQDFSSANDPSLGVARVGRPHWQFCCWGKIRGNGFRVLTFNLSVMTELMSRTP